MALVPKQTISQLLPRFVPFDRMHREELQKLLEQTAFGELKTGELLFRDGDSKAETVYLLSGTVALLHGGEEQVVAADSDRARYPLADRLPRKFTCVARTPVEILRVSRRLSEYRSMQSSVTGVTDTKNDPVADPALQRPPQLNGAEDDGRDAEPDLLENLRHDLAEKAGLRQAVETGQGKQRRPAADDAAKDHRVKVLEAELETLCNALDESDRNGRDMAAEVQHLRQELASLRNQTQHAGEQHQNQAVMEQEVERLRLEVVRLRSECERLQSDPGRGDKKDRQHLSHDSSQQLDQLRQQVSELQETLQEHAMRAAADRAENSALKKEINQFQHTRERHRAELKQAQDAYLRMLEQAELEKSERQRLKQALEMAQGEVEEAAFRRREEIEARKQVENSLLMLQQELGEARARRMVEDDLLSEEPEQSRHGSSAEGRGWPRLRSLLAGALLMLAVLDGLSLIGGRGELVGNLLSAYWPDLFTAPSAVRERGAGGLIQTVPSSLPTTGTGRQGKAVTSREQIAAKRKDTRPVTGSVIKDRLGKGVRGPSMLYIRGGEFAMGWKRPPATADEHPVHRVQVANFAIGRYEVTFDEYDLFARDTGRPLPDDAGWGRGRRPVINITWEDANAYARWLTSRSGQRYRLPTEAEWEYAAAGGTRSYYWWGYQLGKGLANCFNCGSPWDAKSTAPVGKLKPNPFGLHNTAGNVMEWVMDCYHGNYQDAPADGTAWLEQDCKERVARGGAYNKPGDALRTSKRGRFVPDTRLPILGVRLVREVGRG